MYEELPNDPLVTWEGEGNLSVRGRPNYDQGERGSGQELASESKGWYSALNLQKRNNQLKVFCNIFWRQIIQPSLPECQTATLFLVSSQVLTVVPREPETFISWHQP